MWVDYWGHKGMLAPLSNCWGDLASPGPLFLRLCYSFSLSIENWKILLWHLKQLQYCFSKKSWHVCVSVILRNNYYPLNYNNNCFWPLPEYRRLKKWLLSFYFVEFFFNLKELLLPQDVGCMLMNVFDTGCQWNIRIISIFDLCFFNHTWA